MRNLIPASVLSLLLATSAALADDKVKITFLGVGDVYAMGGDGVQGGFARLNAVAKAERAANPNTIYVFDGDLLSPSLMSSTDQGQSAIDLTNLVPFDLAVPGNHEFDFGPDNFFAKAKASAYPWAAINITDKDGKPPAGLSGVMVKEMAGLKIALIPGRARHHTRGCQRRRPAIPAQRFQCHCRRQGRS